MAQLPILVDKQNVKEFLNSFDAFMTDCDGVLWCADTVIDRANLVINKLRTMGKKVFLVTNNSTKSRETYLQKCLRLGFTVDKEDIVGSAYVLASYLQQRNFSKKVYMVGSEGLAQELDAVGIKHTGLGPDPLVGEPMDMIKTVELDPEVGAVVVGFDGHISLPKMLKASSYVTAVPECLFLATNTDECFPVRGTKLTYPGTGSMVRGIECAVGRKATVMGKPEPRMFEVLQQSHQLQPSRTLMVGDRCNTDILLGKNCGLDTLLVLTGVHQMSDLQGWVDGSDPALHRQLPHYYLPSLGALLDLMTE